MSKYFMTLKIYLKHRTTNPLKHVRICYFYDFNIFYFIKQEVKYIGS